MHFLRVGVCAQGLGRTTLRPVAGSDRIFLLQRCRRVRVFPSGSMTVWMIVFVSLVPRSSGFPLAWKEKRSGCSRRCSPMLYAGMMLRPRGCRLPIAPPIHPPIRPPFRPPIKHGGP